MSALIETQQLERRLSDAEDPPRYEARVLGKEALFATIVGTDVTEPVSDDERAPVQDAEGPIRH